VAILSFKDMDSEALWNSASVRAFVNIQKVAMRKLVMLDAAGRLEDLRIPPGNRLEALAGDRAGQHSIRINEHFRVCFVWTSNGPKDVEICDYH